MMAHHDFFELQDVRDSHVGGAKADGERDYVQHVRSRILTAGERLVLFLSAAVLISVAAGGRLSLPTHPTHPQPAAVSRAFDDWHYHVRCEEESPYSGRSC